MKRKKVTRVMKINNPETKINRKYEKKEHAQKKGIFKDTSPFHDEDESIKESNGKL